MSTIFSYKDIMNFTHNYLKSYPYNNLQPVTIIVTTDLSGNADAVINGYIIIFSEADLQKTFNINTYNSQSVTHKALFNYTHNYIASYSYDNIKPIVIDGSISLNGLINETIQGVIVKDGNINLSSVSSIVTQYVIEKIGSTNLLSNTNVDVASIVEFNATINLYQTSDLYAVSYLMTFSSCDLQANYDIESLGTIEKVAITNLVLDNNITISGLIEKLSDVTLNANTGLNLVSELIKLTNVSLESISNIDVTGIAFKGGEIDLSIDSNINTNAELTKFESVNLDTENNIVILPIIEKNSKVELNGFANLLIDAVTIKNADVNLKIDSLAVVGFELIKQSEIALYINNLIFAVLERINNNYNHNIISCFDYKYLRKYTHYNMHPLKSIEMMLSEDNMVIYELVEKDLVILDLTNETIDVNYAYVDIKKYDYRSLKYYTHGDMKPTLILFKLYEDADIVIELSVKQIEFILKENDIVTFSLNSC